VIVLERYDRKCRSIDTRFRFIHINIIKQSRRSKRYNKKAMCKAVCLLAALSWTLLAQPQSDSITKAMLISGRVLDPVNAPISGAVVTLRVPESGAELATARSDSDGAFVLTATPSRAYQLRIVVPGFKSSNHPIPETAAGETVALGNIVLDLGVLCECVTVTIENYTLPKPAEPSQPIDASVCELVKEPARFLNVEVHLRPEIAGPGLDTSHLLEDRSCPSAQLNFGPANQAVTHDWAYRTLEQYLTERSAKATLLGRLGYYLWIGSREPSYTFRIEAVSDLIAGTPGPFAPRKHKQ
jgi:hypothetical protein